MCSGFQIDSALIFIDAEYRVGLRTGITLAGKFVAHIRLMPLDVQESTIEEFPDKTVANIEEARVLWSSDGYTVCAFEQGSSWM